MCRLSLRRWGAYSAPPDSLAGLRVGPGVAEGEMGGGREAGEERRGREKRDASGSWIFRWIDTFDSSTHRANPQPINDLVHICAKRSSSGGNSFCGFS